MQRLREIWARVKTPAAAAANRGATVVSPRVFVREANRWREGYDPWRGLTMARALGLLEAGERGAYAELQWLYRFIEKRDATLCALLSRYEGGLLRLDWTIKTIARPAATPPAADPAPQGEAAGRPAPGLAEAQSAALRAAYERIDNLREAIQFLIGARFRGYAHLEKWRVGSGEVVHLEPVPQWYWVRHGAGGGWEYNREARGGITQGERVDASGFLVREVERAVNEVGLLIHVRRSLCQRDWDGFVETYGVPAMFVIGPAGASSETEAALVEKIEAVMGDYRGYLPYGTQLVSVPTTARGVNPFRTYLKALDEALVLAATGGKLSVMAEAGVGQQAGLVHWRAWREIMQAEALLISETFQRHLDREVLARQFPGQPPLAYFELCAQEEADLGAVIEHAERLARAGYRMDPGQLSERTGYKVTRDENAGAQAP